MAKRPKAQATRVILAPSLSLAPRHVKARSEAAKQRSNMSEAAANANGGPALDPKGVKAALTSSSTSARIAQLRTIDEKLSQKGGFRALIVECPR